MKRLLVFFLFGFIVMVNRLYAQSEIDSSYANGYYVKKMTAFGQQEIRKGGWVFIGNSITEAGHWDKRWIQYPVIDRGISGDNSFGVKNRLGEALRHMPSKVMMMIGVNDLKRGTPLWCIKRNYDAIAEKLYTDPAQPEVYLQSVLPVDPVEIADIYSRISNKDVRKLNRHLKKLARKYGMHYVDLYTVFANRKGVLKEGLHTDHLHLSEKGYSLWEKILQKALE